MFENLPKREEYNENEDIIHILDGGENGYMHPYEINTDVTQGEFREESRDIITTNPATDKQFRICSNEPGNGLDQKGTLDNLFPDYSSDNIKDLLKEVEDFKKNKKKIIALLLFFLHKSKNENKVIHRIRT